jgi:hypothetical protein
MSTNETHEITEWQVRSVQICPSIRSGGRLLDDKHAIAAITEYWTLFETKVAAAMDAVLPV